MKPPKLAMALLTRFVDENEPLVGDLVEEFDSRRSRVWFWRQVIGAVVMRLRDRDREVRPLRLVDERSRTRPAHPAAAYRNLKPINLTASPIHGVGGLGLVAFAVLIAAFAPQAWWLVIATVLGGVLLGAAFVVIGRLRSNARPNGRDWGQIL
jgi:hypothetical protein